MAQFYNLIFQTKNCETFSSDSICTYNEVYKYISLTSNVSPCVWDFFFWWFIKDSVHMHREIYHRVPTTEFKRRNNITTAENVFSATTAVTKDRLANVWEEFDNLMDIITRPCILREEISKFWAFMNWYIKKGFIDFYIYSKYMWLWLISRFACSIRIVPFETPCT